MDTKRERLSVHLSHRLSLHFLASIRQIAGVSVTPKERIEELLNGMFKFSIVTKLNFFLQLYFTYKLHHLDYTCISHSVRHEHSNLHMNGFVAMLVTS